MPKNPNIKRVLALFLLASPLLALIVAVGDRQPSYQGPSLRSWLQQYSDESLEETQRLAQAKEAVQSIGMKQAMPEMLKLLKAKDGPAAKRLASERGWSSMSEAKLVSKLVEQAKQMISKIDNLPS